ncbi:hypothetical protein B5D82_15495 [Cognaticolwellia beringensis]|uniref:Alpha/beta hydrolase n=2 Tax=Cognaticolwellia beringensis TaxID=1967665 RepID=A0A222GB71_9GAMM|nr:hypothetical protein B5D82_15495 [Cognaticolwellia beringensis]
MFFVFAGYGQPMKLLSPHQAWLQHITGAEVFVIQSAENSENFKFGLDFVSPLITEIKRRNPEKVHFVGLSMDAVPAQALAQRVEGSHLHLIAPMTNFSQSSKALWEDLYSKVFYTQLISIDTIEEATKIIFRDSEISPEDIDIL